MNIDTGRDPIAALSRSREVDYFIEREADLLDKLRRRFELQSKLHEMTEETRTINADLLTDLQRLGYTRETLPLVYLAPILYVAWSDGVITDSERKEILVVARERGIEPGSAAYLQLADLLEQRPSDGMLETSLGIVQAIMHAHQPSVEAAEKAEIVAEVRRVLDASGDLLLLWHQMTPNERARIKHLIEELSRDHYADSAAGE